MKGRKNITRILAVGAVGMGVAVLLQLLMGYSTVSNLEQGSSSWVANKPETPQKYDDDEVVETTTDPDKSHPNGTVDIKFPNIEEGAGVLETVSTAAVKTPAVRRNYTERANDTQSRDGPPRSDDHQMSGNVTDFASYRYWDLQNQVLKLPPSWSRRKNTTVPLSLEMLEKVLRDKMSDDSCFKPDLASTRTLVEEVKKNRRKKLPYPFINLGMPKVGSSSLAEFFRCHFVRRHSASHDQKGKCMLEVADEGTRPPIKSCQTFSSSVAHMQLDWNFPTRTDSEFQCAYPQIQLLDEMHEEYPNATFIMVSRPVDSWIRSAEGWYRKTIERNMIARWGRCTIPGLPHPPKNKKLTADELKYWWCGHVHHVREFVKHHPSHSLIELDLYNFNETADTLAALFQAPKTCWQMANVKTSLVNTTGTNSIQSIH